MALEGTTSRLQLTFVGMVGVVIEVPCWGLCADVSVMDNSQLCYAVQSQFMKSMSDMQ